jgi:hypothetical protein
MTGDAVPQERQAAASRAVSCWSRPYSDNNTEDFVTPSTFASAGPLDIRKCRSGSDLSQRRSGAATGRDGIARGAWGSAVILISPPSWFFIAACGPSLEQRTAKVWWREMGRHVVASSGSRFGQYS